MFRSTCIFLLAAIISQANAGLLGNARIIGGAPASERRFYEVLVMGDNTNCTGSFINPKWVVTSAQCAKSINSEGFIQVAYGKAEFDPAVDYHWISQAFVHPSYNPVTQGNDIALLELVSAANGNIQILKLPKQPVISYENERPTVSGWGATANYGDPQPILQQKVISIVENSQCMKAGYPVPRGPMICSRGRSLCEFDLGAPLVLDGKTLIGIGTANNDILMCEDMTYATFTNVGYYVAWMKQITKLAL